jgi:hypothetical protein
MFDGEAAPSMNLAHRNAAPDAKRSPVRPPCRALTGCFATPVAENPIVVIVEAAARDRIAVDLHLPAKLDHPERMALGRDKRGKIAPDG